MVRNAEGCWGWRGDTDRGYPVMRDGGRDGALVRVHVWAWEQHHGEQVPDGMVVRHLCGTPACTRPSDLATGTQAQNCQDTVAHKRTTRGTRNAQAKLTDEDVAEVHRLRAAGMLQRQIAERMGVSRPAISMILNGHRWGWREAS